MVEVWESFVDFLGVLLSGFHDVLVSVPVINLAAWGWAIILLTVAVRIVLLPLAIKQTRSMRAMQTLQPEMKKIQEKYKADKSMMRTHPEKYREKRQKQQEEMRKLYKEHDVNPAAGCLPLLPQLPIFIALFHVLRDPQRIPELANAGFYFVNSLNARILEAGVGGLFLVLLMVGSTFVSQRQMMASNPSMQQSQQKMMLYIMPLILAVVAFQVPIGVVLYWVTTNLWTMGQQYVMFRNVESTTSGDAKPTGA